MPRQPRRPIYFREWRRFRELTQEQLAQRMEIDQTTLSRIENGRLGYTQKTLELLADCLGCEPADLLRPPGFLQNDIAEYVMAMDEQRRCRALRVLRAMEGDDEDGCPGHAEEAQFGGVKVQK